jgi:hypothetical protein
MPIAHSYTFSGREEYAFGGKSDLSAFLVAIFATFCPLIGIKGCNLPAVVTLCADSPWLGTVSVRVRIPPFVY